MLSKDKRLTKVRDFDRVYQKGKRLGNESFNLNFIENRIQITRLGIVVGKKYSKKATERNRAKRVYREAVKNIYSEIKSGFDIIIFVHRTNKEPELKTVQAKLLETLQKGGLV